MRIIIDDVDSGEVSITFEKSFAEEPGSSFQKVYARLMVALEGTIKEFIRKTPVKDKDAFMDHLYDIVDEGFGNLLTKVFPDVDTSFNLTAAAIVYAQDQIIQKAEAEGKTYEEMLDEYEHIADKYIAEKRLH